MAKRAARAIGKRRGGTASGFAHSARAITMPLISWRAARKAVTTRKPHRVLMAVPKRRVPPPIRAEPIMPVDRITAEMWEDYHAFKAAGMLREWRKKWAAYLPN